MGANTSGLRCRQLTGTKRKELAKEIFIRGERRGCFSSLRRILMPSVLQVVAHSEMGALNSVFFADGFAGAAVPGSAPVFGRDDRFEAFKLVDGFEAGVNKLPYAGPVFIHFAPLFC
jgi:hypothetical protein